MGRRTAKAGSAGESHAHDGWQELKITKGRARESCVNQDRPMPKSIYVGEWQPGEHYIVIAAEDGSFQRWPLDLGQIAKLALETFKIAIKNCRL